MLINRLEAFVTTAMLSLIGCYQKVLSPLFGNQCRFHPTCSTYARHAIVMHGSVKGGALAVWRICRCNPACEGGVDPVPAVFQAKDILQLSPTRTHHNGSQT